MPSIISASTTSGTALSLSSDTSGELQIRTGSTPTTAITIDTSQNVGIGTTPSAWSLSGGEAIQLSGSTAIWNFANTNSYFSNNEFYNGTNRIFLANGWATEYAQAGGNHQWFVSSASGTAGGTVTMNESMRIDSSGNVGIGTSSPTSISGFTSLTVNNSSVGGLIDLQCNGTTATRLYANANFAYLYNQTANPLVFGTGGSEKMRITSAGNVGIGTNNPTSSLVVSGSATGSPTVDGVHLGIQSGYATIELCGSSSTGSLIDFTKNNTDYVGRILYANAIDTFLIINNAAGPLTFSTSNTERMRIDSNGALLVGTTATTGSSSNNSRVTGGIFSTFNGTFSSAGSGVTVTLTTLPNTNTATYLVSASINDTDLGSNYTCVAIIRTSGNGSAASITNLATAASATLSVSGSNLQFVQISGVAQPLKWSLLRIL